MTPFVLGGSLAALVVLAGGGLAWAAARGRDGGRIASPEDAADAAERALKGFVAADAVVGADGRAAIVVGTDLCVVVVKAERRALLSRVVTWHAIRAVPGGMLVETDARRFGTVLLAGVDALDMRRLTPAR